MTPLQALNDACRELCGPRATHTAQHDDACLVLRSIFAEWAKAGVYGGGDA